MLADGSPEEFWMISRWSRASSIRKEDSLFFTVINTTERLARA